MNNDIYIEANGEKIATVGSYTAKLNSKGTFDITLTRPYFTDKAIQDNFYFHYLNYFNLVISNPNQDQKIVYSECKWTDIKEIGTPSNMATTFICAVAKHREEYKLSMKIKDHKTGKIFENIKDAAEYFC